MSRDFDPILKEISKSHKELYQSSHSLEKDVSAIKKDIDILKKTAKEIDSKIDELIEIMGNLTIMFLENEEDLMDEEEDDEEDSMYDSDQTWVPEENENWKNTDEEEDTEGDKY